MIFFVTTTKNLLASEPTLVISSVLFDPPGSDNKTDLSSYEKVVLKNISSKPLDISSWEIRMGTYFSLSDVLASIPPQRTLALYLGSGTNNNLDFQSASEASLYFNRTGSQLGDTHGEISLYKSPSHTKNTLVDYVAYGEIPSSANYKHALSANLWPTDDFIPFTKEGCFIELEEKFSFASSDWKSVCEEKKQIKSDSIKINLEKDVYINIFTNFEILGLNPNAKVVWNFGDGHKSYKQKTRHKYVAIGTYSGSVKYPDNNSATVENFEIIVKKISHPKIKIVSIDANPAGNDTNNETITLQNESKEKINLNGWSVATGWKKLANHPIAKDFEMKKGKEKKLTKNFSKFTLNNKKSKIELRYPDGEVADSLKYNKKDSGITEGEVYQKVKRNKWKWIAQNNKKIPKNKLPTENTLPKEENIKPVGTDTTQKTPLEEPSFEEKSNDFIGKFSSRKNQRQIIETNILSFKDSKTNPKFTQKFAFLEQGFVLGISTIKNSRVEHRELLFANFLEKHFQKINLYLNNLFLKLPN